MTFLLKPAGLVKSLRSKPSPAAFLAELLEVEGRFPRARNSWRNVFHRSP